MAGTEINTILDLFAKQVSRKSDHTAVVFQGSVLTYKRLDEKSNQLAHYLIANGLKKDMLVGICVERSLEMLIGILGILKAGGSYIPLDPMYPHERINFMLDDSAAAILITSASLHKQFQTEIQKIFLDDIDISLQEYSKQSPNVPVYRNDLAYTIYTSGSTGKPKGVQIEHHSLLNFLYSMQDKPGITETDTLLALTTISFDIAGLELFLPLTSGAKIILADDALRIDGHRILDTVSSENITLLQATPATWRMILDAGWKTKLPLKALCGGEAFPLDLAKQLWDLCSEVWNLYGPTETTIWSAIKKIERDEVPITIGHPIKNTQIYILDEHLAPVATGEVGEIFIGGAGVARGYLNRPDLNAEKFLANPFPDAYGSRMYRTGDLGKFLPNGEIQCLGRIDNQVKIQGFRIELGEIENTISLFPSVKQNCVHVWEEKYAGKRLVGYLVGEKDDAIAVNELTDFLKKELPDYMVPATFVQLESLPLTSNGKVDRKALPAPIRKRPQTGVLYRAPQTPVQTYIIDSWKTLLEIDKIGVDDNFFELGGNSLLATKTVALLKEAYGFTLPVIKLYQHATASKIAREIEEDSHHAWQSPSVKNSTGSKKGADIAIIGMAGRFPGADNISELWEVLLQGKETTKFFKQEELDPNIPDEEKNHPDYVRARGVINNAGWFDAELFGMSPVMAKLMDPQHRIFLEICRDALESSGHLASTYQGIIGIYAGCGNNTYYTNNLLSNRAEIAKFGAFQTTTLNEKDYLTTRVAYQLDLKGPAVGVYSACSTSLLAVAQAVEGIRSGQCDAALAGGISITVPINSGHIYQEGAMLSNDGHCRPFDADGKGTVFSDGAGVVLLKDLESAKRDGDTIFSVIKGVGVNNDGAGKGSFTAPHPEGQAKAIAMALADAHVDPATISYVETHGTATPLGDPIEIEGLKLAIGKQDKQQYCRIGSIKSNIGHLTHAAGVAGLIKASLSVYHGLIPPSINYSKPNPNIDFEASPFVVNDQLTPWGDDNPRRAGVSSFGVGGTNVHVVIEGHGVAKTDTSGQKEMTLINWSAKSKASLALYAEKLKEFVLQHPDTSLRDIAYTLQTTRHDFNTRAFLSASDIYDLLARFESGNWEETTLTEHVAHITFMFPGQGSQYVGMGSQLYQRESVYREAVDECAEILLREIGEDIRQIMFADRKSEEAANSLRNTYYTQPALFVTEYALARLWMSWGITPTAFIGHSVGEFVAAHLSGVFTLADALKLISSRGRLISQLPPGSMLSVRAAADQLKPDLPAELSIAAINAPNLCVIAGETDLLKRYADSLTQQGLVSRHLHTSHAFHSEMMDPILDDFHAVVNQVTLRVPQKPIVSTVTGQWLKDDEATDPNYWVNHVKATVKFSEALQFLHQELAPVLLEVGPGSVTATLAKQHGNPMAIRAISGLDTSDKDLDEYRSVFNALGKLWQNGIVPDWRSVYGKEQPCILHELPTYAYDRKKHWVSPLQVQADSSPVTTQAISDQDTTAVPAQDPVVQQTVSRHDRATKETLVSQIKHVFEYASGIDLSGASLHANFIELGFDSLLLTQIAQSLNKEFGLPITFRKLNEEYYNLNLLADYLDEFMPREVPPATLPNTAQPAGDLRVVQPDSTPNLTDAIAVLTQQIRLLSEQVARLQPNHAEHRRVEAPAVQAPKDSHYSTPPVQHAKLGKDRNGNPAWFIQDNKNQGKYLQVVYQ